jgi:hypothetical protein
MRKYLYIGNKEVHLGLIIALTTILMVITIVYALTSYVFHQTLVVSGKAIKIYQSDGTTLIPNDSTISSLWEWNSTSNQFELHIVIKNTGTENVTITFSHNAPSNWTVNCNFNQTTIVKGESLNAFVTATPPSFEPGTEATFDINIAAN